MEHSFSTDQGAGDGLGKIQARCVYCALYLCDDYISSTSGHQALDLRGRGPLLQVTPGSPPLLRGTSYPSRPLLSLCPKEAACNRPCCCVTFW